MSHSVRALAGTLALLTLAACGGGGGSSAFDDRVGDASQYANQCAAPRSGTDPYTGEAYPDVQGTLANERDWVHAYMNAIYLWYKEIPSVDSSGYTASAYGSDYAALDAYFQALKTPNTTSSGKLEDQFSFTYPTAAWDALAQSGVTVSYGLQFAALATAPPRDFRVAYTEPNRPSSNDGVDRGAKILAIDGVDMINGSDVDTLNAGLFPSAAGEQHVFRFEDTDGTTQDVTLTAEDVTETPVQNVQTISTSTGSVGYLLFNDHIATAEGELKNAIQTLADDDVSDLVLDIRYNGGGYLDIASELAYMIAGPAQTAGKVFERLKYNDKNPLADTDSATTGFHSTTVGFDPSVADGSALPYLNLSKVYVLVGAGTCSASEAVINGLRGVGVDVVLIGDTTCGKPYGFYQADNCGTSYFAIEFQGVNNAGFGDYADGFTPDCAVDDDFDHALGDPSESLLATALSYRDSGACPSTSKRASLVSPVKVLRSPVRENLIVTPPQR
ncbi:S41 family peptidase [Solimonas marina]|uniref:S41 family peptidase n=1 Tax=Solimonas marina TaxID=2714601 RepID=UPI0019D04570